MATTLTTFTDKSWISDFIKWEQDQRISRKVLMTAANTTLAKGQVVAATGVAVSDVQTLACAQIPTAGSFKLQYGYNVALQSAALLCSCSANDMQVALRALGVAAGNSDLAACTVGLTGTWGAGTASFAITTPITLANGLLPLILVVANTMTLAAGATPVILGTYIAGTTGQGAAVHTTIGYPANCVIALPAAANCVRSLVTSDNTGVGSFMIWVEGVPSGVITYSSNIGTLITNINTVLDATFGAGQIVASGGSLAALVLTFSGSKYAARNILSVYTQPLVNAAGTTYTINGAGAVNSMTTAPVSTAGVTSTGAGVCLQDITGVAGAPKPVLLCIRQAILDSSQVTFGVNVTAEVDKEAVLAALEASSLLVTRYEPPQTTTQTT